ncbi:MAG TPA: hypothetical protein VFF04_02035 [Candidatus Babeliales bacterium]|nr:hypothetical protein [Candidatus Babeliales bacterium]
MKRLLLVVIIAAAGCNTIFAGKTSKKAEVPASGNGRIAKTVQMIGISDEQRERMLKIASLQALSVDALTKDDVKTMAHLGLEVSELKDFTPLSRAKILRLATQISSDLHKNTAQYLIPAQISDAENPKYVEQLIHGMQCLRESHALTQLRFNVDSSFSKLDRLQLLLLPEKKRQIISKL